MVFKNMDFNENDEDDDSSKNEHDDDDEVTSLIKIGDDFGNC